MANLTLIVLAPRPDDAAGDAAPPSTFDSKPDSFQLDENNDIILPSGVRPFCRCANCDAIRNREIDARTPASLGHQTLGRQTYH